MYQVLRTVALNCGGGDVGELHLGLGLHQVSEKHNNELHVHDIVLLIPTRDRMIGKLDAWYL